MDWSHLIRALLLLNHLIIPALCHRILTSNLGGSSSKKFYFHPYVNRDQKGNPDTLVYGFIEMHSKEGGKSNEEIRKKSGYYEPILPISEETKANSGPITSGENAVYRFPLEPQNQGSYSAEKPKFVAYDYDQSQQAFFSVNEPKMFQDVDHQAEELQDSEMSSSNEEELKPMKIEYLVPPRPVDGNTREETFQDTHEDQRDNNQEKLSSSVFQEDSSAQVKHIHLPINPEAKDKLKSSDQEKITDPYRDFWKGFFSHEDHRALLEAIGNKLSPKDKITGNLAVQRTPDAKKVPLEDITRNKADTDSYENKQGKQGCQAAGQYLQVPHSVCDYYICTAGLDPVLMSCPPGTQVTGFTDGRSQGTVNICGVRSNACLSPKKQRIVSQFKQPPKTPTTTTTTETPTTTTTTEKPTTHKRYQEPVQHNAGYYRNVHILPEAKTHNQLYHPNVYRMYPKEKTMTTKPAPVIKTQNSYKINPLPFNQGRRVFFYPYGALPNILPHIETAFPVPGFHPPVQPSNTEELRKPSILTPTEMTYPKLEITKRASIVPQPNDPASSQNFHYGTDQKGAENKPKLKPTTVKDDTVKSTPQPPNKPPTTDCKTTGEKSCVRESTKHYYECINGPSSLIRIRRPCPPGTTTVKFCNSPEANQINNETPCSIQNEAHERKTPQAPTLPPQKDSDLDKVYHRLHFIDRDDTSKPQGTNSGYNRPATTLKTITTPPQDKPLYNGHVYTSQTKNKPLATASSGDEIESIERPTPWYMRFFNTFLPIGSSSSSSTGNIFQAFYTDPTKMSILQPSAYPGHAMSGSPFVPYRGSNKFGNPQPSQKPKNEGIGDTYVKKSDPTRAPHIGYDIHESHMSDSDPIKLGVDKKDKLDMTTQSYHKTSGRPYTLGPHFNKGTVRPTAPSYWRLGTTRETKRPTSTEEPFESANAYQNNNYYYHFV